MAEQYLEASQLGFGTYKYSDTPNNVTLRSLLATAGLTTVPDDVSGFDLYVVSGTAYYENDGTDASADSWPLDGPGPAARARTAKHAFDKYKFFSSGACEFRIQLWG
jgi:hypothetical protein